jgi:integrase
MPLFKQPQSKVWWYSFYFHGKRYRQSTGETVKQAALTKEAAALIKLSEGQQITRKADKLPTLQVFAVRFMEWAENSRHLEPNSRKFYRYGWRLLSFSRLATMQINEITAEVVDCTQFIRPVMDRRTNQATAEVVLCSPTYTNQAIRTLSAMLGQAEVWGMITARPILSAMKAPGRDRLIDDKAERSLQNAYQKASNNPHTRRQREQAWLVMVILQDTGMRPDEVFPMRIENIYWTDHRIWIPEGKTPKAKRFVGMSDRMKQMLALWCEGREGWVFPNPKSATGHLQSIAKGFQRARKDAEIDRRIVPYSARHTYGTFTMAATGNTFAVSKSMGHSDIKSMAPYQHQDINPLNEAINKRNAASNLSHSFSHTSGSIQ